VRTSLKFSPYLGLSLSSTNALAWRIILWMLLLIFEDGISAIRVLSLGFLAKVSEFSAIYLYVIMLHGNFLFMLDVLLGETLREEHKCFLLSQGYSCSKLVKNPC
jgi:hypothetical protein